MAWAICVANSSRSAVGLSVSQCQPMPTSYFSRIPRRTRKIYIRRKFKVLREIQRVASPTSYRLLPQEGAANTTTQEPCPFCLPCRALTSIHTIHCCTPSRKGINFKTPLSLPVSHLQISKMFLVVSTARSTMPQFLARRLYLFPVLYFQKRFRQVYLTSRQQTPMDTLMNSPSLSRKAFTSRKNRNAVVRNKCVHFPAWRFLE